MFSDKFVSATANYSTFDNSVPSPYLRKTFNIDKISPCQITVCGLGYYRIFINGKEITRSHMAPYTSNPDHILYYDKYDLTSYLQVGQNALGFILGNGFLNNMGGFIWEMDKAPFRSAPKLAFSLETNSFTIEADESVKVHPSPIIFDDLRAGEHYDARAEIEDWASPSFDDSLWNNAIIAKCPNGEKRIADTDPILVKKEIKAVKIIKGDGGYIYDFGINTSGIIRLNINATCGQQLKILHSEIINDGKADLSNINFDDRTKPDCNQCIKYTCKEGLQSYSPSFTYMGFRYAYITGITEEQATIDLLTMLVLHSDIKQLSDFTCSDENINKLYQNTLNSTTSNFHHFLTDCPQREKNGWTGDVNLSANQVLLNFSAERNLREWLHNIRKAQTEQGSIPCIIPTAGWGYGWGSGPAWDSALVETVYRIVQYNGDNTVIQENADAIFNLLNYWQTRKESNGLACFGLGDWVQVGIKDCLHIDTPLCVTDTLVCMDTCSKASLLFNKIGQKDRADICQQMSKDFRTAFRTHCIDKELFVQGNTQTGLAMALYYKAFDKKEEPTALNNLLTLIKQKNDHFDVGVLGARVLFRVLADFGYTSLAYKLLLNQTFPSFLYQLNLGATSLWESFYELNERFETINCSPGAILSFNHHFWGDISAFFIEYFAGIKINPDNSDFKTVLIKPNFIEQISAVKSHRDTALGRISVEWQVKNGTVNGIIQIPKETTATLILPNGKKKILPIGTTPICFDL